MRENNNYDVEELEKKKAEALKRKTRYLQYFNISGFLNFYVYQTIEFTNRGILDCCSNRFQLKEPENFAWADQVDIENAKIVYCREINDYVVDISQNGIVEMFTIIDSNSKKEERKEGDLDIIRPSYYKDIYHYEPKDVIFDWGLDFNLGNVLKYIARAGKKNSKTEIEDLKKARQYLDFEIDSREKHNL